MTILGTSDRDALAGKIALAQARALALAMALDIAGCGMLSEKAREIVELCGECLRVLAHAEKPDYNPISAAIQAESDMRDTVDG